MAKKTSSFINDALLHELDLTRSDLTKVVDYLTKMNYLIIENMPFCHCVEIPAVIVRMKNATNTVLWRIGCPACSEICQECDNYTDELISFKDDEGENREVCVDCFQEFDGDSNDDMDIDDIDERVDAILKRAKRRSFIRDPKQRSLFEFF